VEIHDKQQNKYLTLLQEGRSVVCSNFKKAIDGQIIQPHSSLYDWFNHTN
jgi:hypothetical protein